MRTTYLLSVWIHILSAVVWIGGMFFIILVLIPIFRRPEYRNIYSKLFHLVGTRFRWIGWISLILLILTGSINLAYRGYNFSDLWSGRVFQGSFGHILFYKLIFVILILILSVLHDFWIGPRATSLALSNPASLESLRFRRTASWIGRINFLLALIIVAFGIMLVRGHP